MKFIQHDRFIPRATAKRFYVEEAPYAREGGYHCRAHGDNLPRDLCEEIRRFNEVEELLAIWRYEHLPTLKSLVDTRNITTTSGFNGGLTREAALERGARLNLSVLRKAQARGDVPEKWHVVIEEGLPDAAFHYQVGVNAGLGSAHVGGEWSDISVAIRCGRVVHPTAAELKKFPVPKELRPPRFDPANSFFSGPKNKRELQLLKEAHRQGRR